MAKKTAQRAAAKKPPRKRAVVKTARKRTKAPPALRIELKGAALRFQALLPDRFTRHGFGTFLEDVQKGEISITESALDALLRSPYRAGLQGVELFAGRVLAWGAPSLTVTVPLEVVSLHDGAAKWLKECCIIE